MEEWQNLEETNLIGLKEKDMGNKLELELKRFINLRYEIKENYNKKELDKKAEEYFYKYSPNCETARSYLKRYNHKK